MIMMLNRLNKSNTWGNFVQFNLPKRLKKVLRDNSGALFLCYIILDERRFSSQLRCPWQSQGWGIYFREESVRTYLLH